MEKANKGIEIDHPEQWIGVMNYIDMYRYAKKTDDAAIESPNHANLNMISSPRTQVDPARKQ